MIKPGFFDVINYSLCRAVNEYLGDKATEFFRRVGEYHLEEALKRGLIHLNADDSPLEVLIKIAEYLEASGYMEKISIDRLSEKDAIVEMNGVTVAESSAKLLKEGNKPSHFMTNAMFAALRKFAIQADLKDMEYDEKEARFKEYWKILQD
jgi:hypothetical protein